MGRLNAVAVAVGILVIIAGLAVLAFGVFPPAPHPQAVQHTLPNSGFKAH
jgi:hypothetical protein